MKKGQPLPPSAAADGGGTRESAAGRETSPRRYTFPAHLRLKRAAEFERCFAHKVSTADEVLIVYGYPSQLPYPRLGCVVSRKWGKAVRRNRLKRLLREAFRLSQHELPAGIDYVVLPRLTAEVPSLEAIRRSLLRLARRLSRRLAEAAPSPSLQKPPAQQKSPPTQEPPAVQEPPMTQEASGAQEPPPVQEALGVQEAPWAPNSPASASREERS